jgi:hypothetical protein
MPVKHNSTPEDREIKWINAGLALLTGHDPKPLAELLRSDQAPLGIQILIADLLDPPKIDPYHGCKLTLEDPNRGRLQSMESYQNKLRIGVEYDRVCKEINEAQGSNQPGSAADHVAEKKDIGTSTVYRAVRYVRDLKKFLGIGK